MNNRNNSKRYPISSVTRIWLVTAPPITVVPAIAPEREPGSWAACPARRASAAMRRGRRGPTPLRFWDFVTCKGYGKIQTTHGQGNHIFIKSTKKNPDLEHPAGRVRLTLCVRIR